MSFARICVISLNIGMEVLCLPSIFHLFEALSCSLVSLYISQKIYSYPASQIIPFLSRKSSIRHRVHVCPSLVPVLSELYLEDDASRMLRSVVRHKLTDVS
jgi:hypothetical protein